MNVYEEEVAALRDTLTALSDTELPMPAIFLYGPPGTGKTSLAESIDADLFSVVMLGRKRKKKDKEEVPLLEEIDNAVNNSVVVILDEVDKASEEEIKDLMYFLDHRDRSDCIVILTANSTPDELPKALLRPGRISRSMEIGFLEEDKATILFNNLFGTAGVKAKASFDAINDFPKTYQPAAISAMHENWMALVLDELLRQKKDLSLLFNSGGERIDLTFKQALNRYLNMQEYFISPEELKTLTGNTGVSKGGHTSKKVVKSKCNSHIRR